MLYEGYAPHGVAVIVETATDNVVRTVANVRVAFKNHGGNVGTTGSVAFQFKQMGVFRLAPEGIDQDALELDLIDHGLEEMGEGTGEKGEKQLVIRCAFESFGHLQAAIEQRKLPLVSADSEYVAQTPVSSRRTRRRRSSSWWTRSSRTRTSSACSTTSPDRRCPGGPSLARRDCPPQGRVVRSRAMPALAATALPSPLLAQSAAPPPRRRARRTSSRSARSSGRSRTGSRVIVVPTGLPELVSVQISVQTGSRNEVEPGKSGFAHFFEHMMFRGTRAYPPDATRPIITEVGARQNAYTADDLTDYPRHVREGRPRAGPRASRPTGS